MRNCYSYILLGLLRIPSSASSWGRGKIVYSSILVEGKLKNVRDINSLWIGTIIIYSESLKFEFVGSPDNQSTVSNQIYCIALIWFIVIHKLFSVKKKVKYWMYMFLLFWGFCCCGNLDWNIDFDNKIYFWFGTQALKFYSRKSDKDFICLLRNKLIFTNISDNYVNRYFLSSLIKAHFTTYWTWRSHEKTIFCFNKISGVMESKWIF